MTAPSAPTTKDPWRNSPRRGGVAGPHTKSTNPSSSSWTAITVKCLPILLGIAGVMFFISGVVLIQSQSSLQSIFDPVDLHKTSLGWDPTSLRKRASTVRSKTAVNQFQKIKDSDTNKGHHDEVLPLAPPGHHNHGREVASEHHVDGGSSLWDSFLPLVSSSKARNTNMGGSALEPYDLSVNHLPRLLWTRMEGLENIIEQATTPEDFLPTVEAGADCNFRFRLRPVVGTLQSHAGDISAYQIVAHHAYGESSATIIWDSGKVSVDTMPLAIPWGSGNGDGVDTRQPLPPVGTIVQWKVMVWDHNGDGPAVSEPSKFAVGPSPHDDDDHSASASSWTARWITHPDDFATLYNQTRRLQRTTVTPEFCALWKKRRPIPLARTPVEITDEEARRLTSALLVVSGLGSFAVSWNGTPLSSSSVQDPPLTDYSQRVSYRGYDVTNILATGSTQQHLVAITMGTGWWDGLPINGKIVFQDLMPKGSVTAIAELHLRFDDGTGIVKIATTDDEHDGTWEMGKGHIVESNLYTGEIINLATLRHNQGWDLPEHARLAKATDEHNQESQQQEQQHSITWVKPILYKPGIDYASWHKALQDYAYDHTTHSASNLAPIGKLHPNPIPPVMPIERIPSESVTSLGQGRWLYDFGKGFAGVVRFEKGLPPPIIPPGGIYPRNHNVTDQGSSVDFITVVYGDSIEMTTGDINLVLVAGYGYHNGGWKRKAGVENPPKNAGPCWPPDHEKVLTQRDVYLLPHQDDGPKMGTRPDASQYFAMARQSRFTFHGFRYAEICCTEHPPQDVYAIKYRTAFQDWGEFSSSNVVLNGAYEMTRNSFDSNTLSVQSDCPHREKLQYGGDMIANSPAALHYFDVSAFYYKIIQDWTDSQWDNGAYTTTSVFMDILRDMSIGQKGSGETVWASLAPVLTARHMQNYGDISLLKQTLENHIHWMDFLLENWDAGMQRKYPGALEHYTGGGSGLGDWLAMMPRDNWITHHAFYLASIRAVAYVANKLLQFFSDSNEKEHWEEALNKAKEKNVEIEKLIRKVYKGDKFSYSGYNLEGLGQNLGLFARVANGTDRCTVLRSWLASAGGGKDRNWPGDEEKLFHMALDKELLDEMISNGYLRQEKSGSRKPVWKLRYAINSGILDVKYTFKTLSDMGFHDIGLSKASAVQFPSFGYMMAFNATTVWETWWRSEDLYSRNHPMFGAIGEWLPSSVAGVSLHPTTVGGQELVFWPRLPMNRLVVDYASAVQGTKRGNAAIAWKFVGGENAIGTNVTTNVLIRLLVPPSTKANLRLPPQVTKDRVTMRVAREFPDMYTAKEHADIKCDRKRRTDRYGFPYHYSYDRLKAEWSKVRRPSKLGTPCESYLWELRENDINWIPYSYEPVVLHETITQSALQPGSLFEIEVTHWQFEEPIPDLPGYSMYSGDIGPFCSNPQDFVWDVNDALHMM